MSSIKDDEVWGVIKAFLAKCGLLSHQKESFDRFFLSSIPFIIQEQMPLYFGNGRYAVEMQNPIFHPPCVEGDGRPVYPMECIEQSRSYRSELSVDITVRDLVEDLDRFHEGVSIAILPVMVGSSFCNLSLRNISLEEKYRLRECPYDEGGYFIVKGTSKILVCQDRPITCYNRVYVFLSRKMPPYDHYAEVRSISNEYVGRSTTVVIGIGKKKKIGRLRNEITAVIPYMSDKTPILLGVLFKALGARDEKEILDTIFPDGPTQEDVRFLTYMLEQSFECKTQQDAYVNISNNIKRFDKEPSVKRSPQNVVDQVKNVLKNQFFLHIKGTTDEEILQKKRLFLGYMVKRLIDVRLGRDNPDDKDHYATKRATTPGILLEKQFSRDFRRLCSDIVKAGELAIERKNTIDVKTWVKNKSTNITASMTYCISIGMFGGKMIGVSQNYDRFNFVASLANARKISTPINESGKVIGPRQLHGSHWGVCCPYATPEGKKAGLLKDLAITCRISIGENSGAIKEFLRLDPDVFSILTKMTKMAKVFVNNDWHGITRDGRSLTQKYRHKRRLGSLNLQLSISFNSYRNEVRFSTEGGRFYRPLFLVHEGDLRFNQSHLPLLGKENSWDKLLDAGVIEFVDKEEEEEMVVQYRPSDLARMTRAERLKVTHCELHPSMILSTSASVIPYPDRNQAPRNSYAAQMAKQAVGIPGLNFNYRVKGNYNVLNTPQVPLVQTKASEAIGLNSLPAGTNIILAVASFMGYNQEDSLVFNKASIDRGLFDMSRFMIYYAEIKKTEGEAFGIPTRKTETRGILVGRGAAAENLKKKDLVPESPYIKYCNKKLGDTSKLDPILCHVCPGGLIKKGDVLIGRVVKTVGQSPHAEEFKDISTVYTETFPGSIHRAERGVNASGYEYIRVVVSQSRKAQIGDKFAALHAQKGTIGKIVAPEDLPFTQEGIIPDALINPLAFPSRMTIAMFVEMLVGKAVSLAPEFGGLSAKDMFLTRGTPFDTLALRQVEQELAAHGFQMRGKETMFNGITGKMLPAKVFIGPVYYQRLKHMVVDKIHARARGSHTSITRQPKEGRQFGGGFRIGYMERDNLAGQGAAAFLRDRLLENSDDYTMWFCSLCGVQAVMSRKGHGECTLCKSRDVRKVRLPYATKLLMQELQGMGIMTRVVTTTFDHNNPKIEAVGKI